MTTRNFNWKLPLAAEIFYVYFTFIKYTKIQVYYFKIKFRVNTSVIQIFQHFTNASILPWIGLMDI